MSRILHKTIPTFRNPVTQAIGGTAFNDTKQSIPLKSKVYAIAIAPDSQVDIVRLFPNGMKDFNTSILVSTDAPFVGELDQDVIGTLVAVPVRPVAPLDAITAVAGISSSAFDVPMAQYPQLKLAIYTECPPTTPPPPLAPFVRTYLGTTPDDGDLVVAFPLSGRTRLGVQGITTNHTGTLIGVGTTWTLDLYAGAVDDAGNLGNVLRSGAGGIATLIRNADAYGEIWQTNGVNGGGSAQAGWVHWTTGVFTIANGAASPNTFDYRVLLGARAERY